ncbi:MAG: cytochrome c family protein [Pirellulales bacterium]|nr:cytochrome c family protein [Pirellulales bacterium]
MSIRAIVFGSTAAILLSWVALGDPVELLPTIESDRSLTDSHKQLSAQTALSVPSTAGPTTNTEPPRLFSADVTAVLAQLPETCGGSLHRQNTCSIEEGTKTPQTKPATTSRAESIPKSGILPVTHQEPAVNATRETTPDSTTAPLPPGIAGDAPPRTEVVQFVIDQAHADCFTDDPFPSAAKCKTCHPGHFREWSVSAHAYAQLSPVFNAMYNKINKLNNGTLGDFCIRCHTPVGLTMGEPLVMSNMDRHPTSREGVTCVVCHRVNQAWGKGSGRLALVAGGLNAPIYGPTGSKVLQEVFANPDKYGVLKPSPDPDTRGRDVHQAAVPFFALTTPAFCGACHDVFAPNGFRLEDAFSEFKSSPAAREKQQSCQDCHMSIEPGRAAGYACEPAAQVGNTVTPSRKRTNHMIVGPDYPIVHPGIFPHNPEAMREEHVAFKRNSPYTGLATMREWLQFDYRAGWGTIEFEHNLPENSHFPPAWQDAARRFRAADILRKQFELRAEARALQHQVLSTGYQLGEIELVNVDQDGLDFRILVFNGTDGHGVPTGFDAERLVFLRVTVADRQGRIVFVSGDLDPNGDVRDSHSFYVHNGKLPLDRQLFSLQSRFITRNVFGGEREQILNVPYSLDPLPYMRPETRPFTVLGRPLGARKHKQNLAANRGWRYAKYHIDAKQLTCDGPYTAHVELIAGMVPVNLVHEISSVGFDYDMSAREVANEIVAGHLSLHSRNAVFRVHEQ